MGDHSKRVYNSVTEMLSSEDNPTPIVRLNRVNPLKNGQIFAKLEWYNPFGAVKDRIAANLVADAEERGQIKAGQKLVEPTSGNTGMALTMLANAKGYSLQAPLSSMIPLEKRALLRFVGCETIELEDTLCPAPGAPEGAIALAHKTASLPEFHMLDQYSNTANPQGHYKTTGPEIWRQTEGRVTHFVAALGTCGTITGTGRFLKEKNPDIKVVGVHPEEGHDIPGVRSIRQLQQTKLFEPALYDQMIEVSNKEAFEMCLRLNREESLIAGPSSGLALAGALKFLQNDPEAMVVVMFPDNIFKYMSTLQRHFPEMFSSLKGSVANPNSKNENEEMLKKMIELSRNEINTIELDQARELKERGGAVFIDVRPLAQYQATHIRGAKSVPMEELINASTELPKDQNQAIITVCNRGNLSLNGMLVLKSLGYSNVRSLNGGTIGWQDRGFEVEGSQEKK